MKIKCAVASTLISIVFVSQAFPVLRPLFPIKPAAPFNGELIVIGDELVLRSAKKASAWTACIQPFVHADLRSGFGHVASVASFIST